MSARGRVVRWAVAGTLVVAALATGMTQAVAPSSAATDDSAVTVTPVKHVVVLFDENVSFDHYFATYPYAANTDGTPFTAGSGTPTDIDTELSAGLIPGNELAAHNPNAALASDSHGYTAPNPNSYQPQRLASHQAVTCDQNHSYGPEQSAVDGGAMDDFSATSSANGCATGGQYGPAGLSMDYYDGNTVTGLWNYAQHYAMSDNNWDAVFGPSTPGALNVVSGNTYSGSSTVNGDVDPNGDGFGSNSSKTTPTMQGANVGDLLNAKGVSWGWFQGGFASKSATTTNLTGAASEDYSSHHNPFEYYASTQNKAHTAPTSGADTTAVGKNATPANHEFDLDVFDDIFSDTAVNGVVPQLPAVSFLKAPEAEDGHASYSDPLDEQEFLTRTIDEIEASPYWSSTAIVVTYDDSDGWYDHVAPTITNSSTGVSGDTTICTHAASAGVPALAGESGRCGPSQRLPLLVISPYAKQDYVSHALTSQASVLKFIEENWATGTIDAASSVPGSFDASANSLDDMFDFSHPQQNEVLLDSTMYAAGHTSCASGSTVTTTGCLNPAFGAVTGTPADATPPVAAPAVDVAHDEIAYPQDASLPTPGQFLSDVGAHISAGTLDVPDLSGVDPSVVGTYPVTITGADAGIAATPQTVEVEIAPVVSVTHPTLVFPLGASVTPTYLRSAAGAAITQGTLDLPSLDGVDFDTPGSYQVQITGSSSGIQAFPAAVTVVVQAASGDNPGGGSGGGPVVSLATPTLTYEVGPAPAATDVAAAAGATISSGGLDPIDLSGVDFTTPGTYTVQVTGADGDTVATPATLTIVVVQRPVIGVRSATVTTTVGTALSSDQVLAQTFATIDHGALLPVDLSAVDFTRAGSYPVLVQGSDHGVAAQPVRVTLVVKPRAAVTTPHRIPRAPVVQLAAPKGLTPAKRPAVRVQLATAVTGGTVTAYLGRTRLTSKHFNGRTVTLRLPRLAPGRHRVTITVTAGGATTTKVVTLRVKRRK
jgi:phospholipase C